MTTPSPEYFVDDRLSGCLIHYKASHRANAESLIVFMPAALGLNREDRAKPVFSRFRWADFWPDSEVMAFADPSIQQAPEHINAAWYVHPEHDLIQAIADVARDHAEKLGIKPERIVFYGSSLGGFGAIGAASCLDGARAIAEVPQIDLKNWMRSAWRLLEAHVMKCSIDEYRVDHPEQLSLQARLEKSGRIPPIRLITNPEDRQRWEQAEFFEWVKQSELPKGVFEFVDTTEVSGHAALGYHTVQTYLRP